MDVASDGHRPPVREQAALLERVGHIAVITLNRPHALNAVDRALSSAAGQALEDAAHDPSVRAVVLTGAGRAFCAGADLKEVGAGRDVAADGHPEWGFAGIVRHFIAKPVIAAVNGYALGGGTEIVLACDLAVIDAEASLGLPEVTRGLFAAAGGVIRLQRQVPLKVASEMALTGDPIDAATAHRWGLVNRVAEPGTALAQAMRLAQRIADNAPLAVQASKELLQRGGSQGSDWGDEAWEANAQQMASIWPSQDAEEGIRAFVEKRPPIWQG